MCVRERERRGDEVSPHPVLLLLLQLVVLVASATVTILDSYATALSTMPKVEKCVTVTSQEHALISPLERERARERERESMV